LEPAISPAATAFRRSLRSLGSSQRGSTDARCGRSPPVGRTCLLGALALGRASPDHGHPWRRGGDYVQSGE
jgi:hypothetical protein